MPTKNDITGKPIQSKPSSNLYRENWERIFGPKENSKNPPLNKEEPNPKNPFKN